MMRLTRIQMGHCLLRGVDVGNEGGGVCSQMMKELMVSSAAVFAGFYSVVFVAAYYRDVGEIHRNVQKNRLQIWKLGSERSLFTPHTQVHSAKAGLLCYPFGSVASVCVCVLVYFLVR